MRNRYYRWIQQMTGIGFFWVAAFAVKTFYQEIPDKMYVEVGQEVAYEFDVPVSVVLKEESQEVFDNFSQPTDIDEASSYTVTDRKSVV